MTSSVLRRRDCDRVAERTDNMSVYKMFYKMKTPSNDEITRLWFVSNCIRIPGPRKTKRIDKKDRQ